MQIEGEKRTEEPVEPIQGFWLCMENPPRGGKKVQGIEIEIEVIEVRDRERL